MRVPTKLAVQTALTLALLGAALFVPAGTLRIPEFWLYLAINAVVMVGSLLWLPPDLRQERARPGGKPMGPAYIPVALVPFIHWVAAGLDRRFRWSALRWSSAASRCSYGA